LRFSQLRNTGIGRHYWDCVIAVPPLRGSVVTPTGPRARARG